MLIHEKVCPCNFFTASVLKLCCTGHKRKKTLVIAVTSYYATVYSLFFVLGKVAILATCNLLLLDSSKAFKICSLI